MVVFYMHFFNNPSNLRNACRNGIFTSTTSGHAPGYMQANVVILESSEAIDFSIFCQKNSKACPLLEVLKPGDPEPKRSAPNADIRTDLPLYKIFYNGLFSHETLDILDLWQDNFVTFLIGCSFTAEDALKKAAISRFRPIVLTSVTTIAGLAPLIFEKSMQAQFIIPMAIAIAYGLLAATFLTLVFLPITLYSLNFVKVITHWLITGEVFKDNSEKVEASVKELKYERLVEGNKELK